MKLLLKRSIVTSVCLILYTSPSWAFKPKAEFGHVGIVRDAVETITRTTTTGDVIRFSDRAIEQLRDATAGVDEVFSSRGELSDPIAHCDDELLPECSQRLINLKVSTISSLTDEASRDGEAARAEAGRALHTLQDFYSHSNWVNNPGLNNTGINTKLGRSIQSALPIASATCIDDIGDDELTGAGITSVTSGYFSLNLTGEPPAGKCAHGKFGGGIHKDTPGRAFHTEARAVAVQSTRNYINLILDATGVAGNDDAIRAFMDVRGTLGFVVDNTGSMGGVIAGVKNQVQRIVSETEASPDKKPDDYLLVEFGDPDVGSPFKTTDAGVFSTRVNAIGANGGGDCPELANSGLLKAVGSASGGSKLFFFSDASAKDSYLGGNVAAAATAKKISINYVLTGTCASASLGQSQPAVSDPTAAVNIDSSYERVAQDTGGQVFFIPTSQVESVYSLIEPVLSGSFQPISIVNGSLSSETKSYEIPVDSSMENVFFSVSLDSISSIVLSRPNGDVVSATDPDVTITDLATGRIFSVSSPESGAWDLSLSGSGDLSISVQGDSDIEFNDFSFVEVAGRPFHQGFFPISGQPLSGVDYFIQARLFAQATDLEFSLVTLDGDLIRTVAMASGGVDENSANDDYVGNMIVPSDSFRVVVSGVDSSGTNFQRIFPKSFFGQSIKVTAVSGFVRLLAGEAVSVKFDVENNGTKSEIFDFSAADDLGFVVSVTPESARIGAGATRRVSVLMAAPSTAVAEEGTMSLVAQGQTNVELNNSALLSVSVVEPEVSTYVCDGKTATIVGTNSDDVLRGTAGDDVIVALGGNDIVYGNGGADTLCGDRGNDKLYGGIGDDVIFGGFGHDVLAGAKGNDTLYGENGSDKLIGSYGDDKLFGGQGSDRLYGNSGHDELRGEGNNDLISGGSGADIILGGDGNDTISSDSNNDVIKGGAGNDVIDGGSGHDAINGNAGRDKLQGGTGTDALKGGPDSDRCAADTFAGAAASLELLAQAALEDSELFNDGSNDVVDREEQINRELHPTEDTASSCEVKIGY